MASLEESSEKEGAVVRRITGLLGGERVLRYQVRSRLDAHDLLKRGLPGKALTHFVASFVIIQKSVLLEKALGMSLRTFQRHKERPTKPLSPEQSGRTWKFAELLAKATAIFGSQREAEQWLEHPAIGLDRRRPIDLLATPAGEELVEDFLSRLEYGVYV